MEFITKIMCAVDCAHSPETTIRVAGSLARELGATLDIVYVYEYPAFGGLEGPPCGSATRIARAMERAQACLSEYQKIQASQGTQVTTHLLEGVPAQALEHHIDASKPGLLVFGVRLRHGIKDFYLPTVAEQVAQSCSIPMIPVRLNPANP
jgi:nucleotide-binding universal stress UspA family protein